MKRLKAYFNSHYDDFSSVLLPLVMLCIPLGPSPRSIAVVLALVFILFSPQFRLQFREIVKTPTVLIIVTLIGFVLLGCLWSDANLHLKLSVVEKYSKLLYLPLLAIGFIHQKSRYYGILAYLCGILITLCTYFYIYWFNNPTPGVGYLPESGYVFYNHIVVGYMMAFATYLAAWMAINTAKLSYKIGFLTLIYLFSFQILTLSGSRTGYVIYALLFLLFCIQHVSLKSVRYTVLFFVVSFIALFALSHSNTLAQRTQMVSQEFHAYQLGQKYSSVGLRLQFHQYAKSLFLAKPIFGQGTGGFAFHFSQDDPVPGWDKNHPDPHSQYWHTASELGVLGILLLCLLFGILFKLSFALSKMQPILQATLIPFAVVCFSDTVLLTSGIGYMFVAFTGLCFGELIAIRHTSDIKTIQPEFNPTEYRLE